MSAPVNLHKLVFQRVRRLKNKKRVLESRTVIVPCGYIGKLGDGSVEKFIDIPQVSTELDACVTDYSISVNFFNTIIKHKYLKKFKLVGYELKTVTKAAQLLVGEPCLLITV